MDEEWIDARLFYGPRKRAILKRFNENLRSEDDETNRQWLLHAFDAGLQATKRTTRSERKYRLESTLDGTEARIYNTISGPEMPHLEDVPPVIDPEMPPLEDVPPEIDPEVEEQLDSEVEEQPDSENDPELAVVQPDPLEDVPPEIDPEMPPLEDVPPVIDPEMPPLEDVPPEIDPDVPPLEDVPPEVEPETWALILQNKELLVIGESILKRLLQLQEVENIKAIPPVDFMTDLHQLVFLITSMGVRASVLAWINEGLRK